MSQVSRPARTLAIIFAAACGLIACGEEGAAPAPALRAEGIPDVQSHLAVVASLASVPVVMPMAAGPAVVPPAYEFLCTGGGAREKSTVLRESPWQDDPVAAERVEYFNCLRYHDPGNPAGGGAERRGIEEHGEAGALNDVLVTYSRAGSDDASVPLEYHVSLPGNDGLVEQSDRVSSRIDTRATLAGTGSTLDATVVRTHEVFILYSNGSRFEGRYRLGTPAYPFQLRSRNLVSRLSGEYEIDTARCSTGIMRVETLQDLEYDAARSGFSRGRLRFIAADGAHATATFLGDGSVRFEGGDGQTSEVSDWRHASAAWANDCFGEWRP